MNFDVSMAPIPYKMTLCQTRPGGRLAKLICNTSVLKSMLIYLPNKLSTMNRMWHKANF